jgi:flagellar protein FliO/FliZ
LNLAAETPPPLPSTGLGPMGLEVAGVLFLILGIILAGFWLLRRYGPKTGLGVFQRGGLAVEGHLGLGPKRSLVVVRFLNTRLVLGVTESSITLLKEVDLDHADPGKDFAKTMEKEGGPGRPG